MKNTEGRRQKAEESGGVTERAPAITNVSRPYCLAEKPFLGFKDLQALQEFPQ